MDSGYIGVDIGGSFTKGGLVKCGEIVYKTKMQTKIGSLESLFDVIDKVLENCGDVRIAGIGIGVAGMVVGQRVLLSAANLGLADVDIAGAVEGRYKVPVKIGNDVSCFALAEAKASDIDNLVYLAVGTGINIGVINNGKLFCGANGASIEYGHTRFCSADGSGESCSCGLRGCVEQYISGNALMSRGKKFGIKAVKPEEVFAASRKIADWFLDNLGVVLVNISNSYRPQKIFIGGGLAATIAPQINMLNEGLKLKNYGYKNAPAVIVEISKLASDGAVLGAASLVE